MSPPSPTPSGAGSAPRPAEPVPAHGDADLTAAASAISRGDASAVAALEASLDALRAPACRHAFVRDFADEARRTAAAADAARAAGRTLGALAGLAVSVKDLFDVRGVPTTAASKAMADAPPAAADCSAVARLRAAGAALVGHTNLTEFAFSGLGLNPHHGTPVNPTAARLDGEPRIPGGSTSGGAVSVAAGAAWAALGSDTGGSIRIPAALCGLVGFKNTQSLTPLDGTVPLSTSLDTCCAITRSVRDAVLLHEVLAARRVSLPGKPLSALRFALPRHVLLDGLDPTVARAFERALSALRAQGAVVEDVTLDGLQSTAEPQALAGIVAAEAWAWHRERLAERAGDYDPRVAARIRRGEALSAADYLDLLALRRDWQARVERSIPGFDAVICPTVPMVAPPIAPLVASDELFTKTNVAMLRNPSVVNQLDGCAISLPCHAPDELPVGLMLFAPRGRDDALLDAALRVEAALAEGRAA